MSICFGPPGLSRGSIIFILALVWVAWKLLVWGIRAAWGVAKILGTVLLIPLFLFGLGCFGSIYLAIPILIIVGIFALLRALARW